MSEADTEAPISDGAARSRRLSAPWRVLFVVWTAASILLCFNQQFTLRFFVGFTLLDTEYFWGLIALLLPLAFLLYPVKPGVHTDHVPWYDVLAFAAASAASSTPT